MVWQALWMLASSAFISQWWCPPKLRVRLLRVFGAEIGSGVVIKHRVRIHWPWKLTIGNDSWIGENAYILNLEPVTIGHDVCVSQEAMLCTGSHDHRSPTFEFDNAPIRIEDGAWIATRATVLRGCTVGRGAIVGASALVTENVAPDSIVLAPRAVTLER